MKCHKTKNDCIHFKLSILIKKGVGVTKCNDTYLKCLKLAYISDFLLFKTVIGYCE